MPFKNPMKFINESYIATEEFVDYTKDKSARMIKEAEQSSKITKEEIIEFLNKFTPVFESYVNLLANYVRSKGAAIEDRNINLNEQIEKVVKSVAGYIAETDTIPPTSLLKEYSQILTEACKRKKKDKTTKALNSKESIEVLKEVLEKIMRIEKTIYETKIKPNLENITKEIIENGAAILETEEAVDLTVLVEREIVKRILNRSLLEAIFGGPGADRIEKDNSEISNLIKESIEELSDKIVKSVII
jgi:hypothetical protein